MDLYNEVIEVLEKKYGLSSSHAGSLAEDVPTSRYDELESKLCDADDIAEMIYNGTI